MCITYSIWSAYQLVSVCWRFCVCVCVGRLYLCHGFRKHPEKHSMALRAASNAYILLYIFGNIYTHTHINIIFMRIFGPTIAKYFWHLHLLHMSLWQTVNQLVKFANFPSFSSLCAFREATARLFLFRSAPAPASMQHFCFVCIYFCRFYVVIFLFVASKNSSCKFQVATLCFCVFANKFCTFVLLWRLVLAFVCECKRQFLIYMPFTLNAHCYATQCWIWYDNCSACIASDVH